MKPPAAWLHLNHSCAGLPVMLQLSCLIPRRRRMRITASATGTYLFSKPWFSLSIDFSEVRQKDGCPTPSSPRNVGGPQIRG